MASSYEMQSQGYQFFFNTTVGQMGQWRVHRQVYLVRSGNRFFDSPYPYGLNYACMLQTSMDHSFTAIPDMTYIERTFSNIVPGASYYVSFWTSLRGDYGTSPLNLYVYLNGATVYSVPPLNMVWTQAMTRNIIANSTSLTLRFVITKVDSVNRSVGITGIILYVGSGTRKSFYFNLILVHFCIYHLSIQNVFIFGSF
jgi:hypothetical protein